MVYAYNSYIVNNSYDLHINSYTAMVYTFNSYTVNNRYSLHF